MSQGMQHSGSWEQALLTASKLFLFREHQNPTEQGLLTPRLLTMLTLLAYLLQAPWDGA